MFTAFHVAGDATGSDGVSSRPALREQALAFAGRDVLPRRSPPGSAAALWGTKAFRSAWFTAFHVAAIQPEVTAHRHAQPFASKRLRLRARLSSHAGRRLEALRHFGEPGLFAPHCLERFMVQAMQPEVPAYRHARPFASKRLRARLSSYAGRRPEAPRHFRHGHLRATLLIQRFGAFSRTEWGSGSAHAPELALPVSPHARRPDAYLPNSSASMSMHSR